MTRAARLPKRYWWLAALLFAVYLVVLHIGIQKGRAAERRAAEGNHLVNVAIQGQAYALDHDGLWPQVDTVRRRFTYEPDGLPARYAIADPYGGGLDHPIEALLFGHLTRHRALTLATDGNPDGHFYLGFAVSSESEGDSLIAAVGGAGSLDRDVVTEPGKGTLGSSLLYRIRQDLPDHLAEAGVTQDADRAILAQFPVIIERPKDGHAWVFYLDGHTEYLPYPGEFPLTERFVKALGTAGN